jgi:hypothetical protein
MAEVPRAQPDKKKWQKWANRLRLHDVAFLFWQTGLLLTLWPIC